MGHAAFVSLFRHLFVEPSPVSSSLFVHSPVIFAIFCASSPKMDKKSIKKQQHVIADETHPAGVGAASQLGSTWNYNGKKRLLLRCTLLKCLLDGHVHTDMVQYVQWSPWYAKADQKGREYWGEFYFS